MDRFWKLREKKNSRSYKMPNSTVYRNHYLKQSKLQKSKKKPELSKPQRIVFKHISKTPATLDEISRSIHEKTIQGIKRILSRTPASGDNKNDDYFPKLEKTTKRVKITLNRLEKMKKIVNKNGKYSLVTVFTPRKKNFKSKKSPLRKMKRKSNSNSVTNSKRKKSTK